MIGEHHILKQRSVSTDQQLPRDQGGRRGDEARKTQHSGCFYVPACILRLT